MRVLTQRRAQQMGYAADKRKRRRQHRKNAQTLMQGGTFLNPGRAPRGSIPGDVAAWHLQQARWVGR